MRHIKVGLALLAMVGSRWSCAATIDVPGDEATIQAALDAAVTGDEIVLASGVYDIGGGLAFPVDGLTLRSASGDPLDVTLHGGGAAFPIQALSRTGIVLQGLTITACDGAIRTTGGLTIRECRLVGNAMLTSDAAVWSITATLALDGCLFSGNTQAQVGKGSGVFAFGGSVDVTGCVFLDNTSALAESSPLGSGSAISTGLGSSGGAFEATTLAVTGSVFGRNAGDLGGAIGMFGGDATIDRCLFYGNTATWGGAVFFRSGAVGPGPMIGSSARVTNSVFTGNRAVRTPAGFNGVGGAAGAGGEAFVELVNSTCYANQSEGAGGVMFWGSDARVVVANCVLAENGATALFGSGVSTQVFNVSGTAVALGLADADGDDDTPGTADDDLRPGPGSPAIDSASSEYIDGEDLDFDGGGRFSDDDATPNTGEGDPDYLDAGAFEYRAPPCSPADLAAAFGVLDFNDVIAFLAAFGAMDASADLAEPIGILNFNDVIAYLNLFAAGCP